MRVVCAILAILIGTSRAARNLSKIAKELGVDLNQREAELRSLSSSVQRPIPLMRMLMAPLDTLDTKVPKDRRRRYDKDFMAINRHTGISPYLFQGDIHLTEDQLSWLKSECNQSSIAYRRKRQSRLTWMTWTNNTVNYYLEPSLGPAARAAVTTAISRFEALTCVRFNNNKNATNRVRVFKGSGCYSTLGMTGKQQVLSLGAGCETAGIAGHEFTHSLGFWHTQMRSDRDDYVTVDLTYVDPNKAGNFIKIGDNKSINYEPYDYASFMHYRPDTFVNTQGETSITAKDPRYLYTMGVREISFYDAKMINDRYECHANCAWNGAACQNGGYPNPNNCQVCNCPLGYGGPMCDQRPAEGCGSVLVAGTDYKNETIVMGSTTTLKERKHCTYWIAAPPNTTIVITITDIVRPKCSYGCTSNALEIKYLADKGTVNPRICCLRFIGQTFTSALNPTPIIAFNKGGSMTVNIQYRYVTGASV